MARARVLFLCTHNSARSQLAEALLRHYGGDRCQVRSAGLEPDPADIEDPVERVTAFRRVRNEIAARIRRFVLETA